MVAENLKSLNGNPIGIDIDGVTQATYFLALNHAAHNLKMIKPPLVKNLIGYWELINIVQANGMSDRDQATKYAKALWNNDNVYLRSPAMLGITTLLKIFNEVHLPYIFISSRPVEFLSVTQEWFAQTLPWVKSEDVILGRPEEVSGGYFKAAMITKHRVLLHIEDGLEEAQEIVEKTPAGVIIVPQPWNIGQRINHPRIKQFRPQEYEVTKGIWPVIKFLASSDARTFLQSVAQY